MFRPGTRKLLLLAGILMVPPAFGQIDGLVDPTAPLQMPLASAPAAGQAGTAGFELSSILIRGSDRIAVINAMRVREGDRVGNALVQSIEQDAVLLELGGESRRLPLYGSSIRSSAMSSNQQD